ncbi:MAG: hypothetical protein ACFFG0_03875 [Candidatus Thorarchaeota archaeon]
MGLKMPCDGCLILPICKERLRKTIEDRSHRFYGFAGWVILRESCTLVKDHLKKIGYHGTWNKKLGQLEDNLKRIYGETYTPSGSYSYFVAS